jgi:hypothetical protein
MRRQNKKRNRRTERQKQAIERQESYNELTTEQKIAKLDKKLGKGAGAVREREKLSKKPNKKTKRK